MHAIATTPHSPSLPNSPSNVARVLHQLETAIAQELAPQVPLIDAGIYPREFMHRIGSLGGFAQTVSPQYGGTGGGVRVALGAIEAISRECLCTGFMSWCQIACTWYLQHSDNALLKQDLLPRVASGEVLGGTGLSNPMKHFAGIEKVALTATPCPGGYRLNGLLPWVSNIGPQHPFGIVARIADTSGYLMAIVSDDLAGLTLKQNAHFIALEGSNTYSCQFRDVLLPESQILAAPCDEYIARIRPGFILTQVGMGLGLVASCLEIMERSNRRYGAINAFLDDRAEHLSSDLEAARQRAYTLADCLNSNPAGDKAILRETIRSRIVGSELSLRAAQAMMLHVGARGYLENSVAERKLRESYFVAIVTPALKHLKKMLHDLEDRP